MTDLFSSNLSRLVNVRLTVRNIKWLTSYWINFFFWSFGINDSSIFCIENWVLLKSVLGGVRDVALFIISHEQTIKLGLQFSFYILVWLLSRDWLFTRIFIGSYFRKIRCLWSRFFVQAWKTCYKHCVIDIVTCHYIFLALCFEEKFELLVSLDHCRCCCRHHAKM